jgi:putative transcriptional regulator
VLQVALESGTLQRNQVRFFVGYSGWSPGQLDDEITRNSWFVGKAKAEDLMNPDIENLWQKVLQDMGSNFSLIAGYPEDPNLN